MADARLDILRPKLREVVDDYRAGRLVIPEFQREYVWRPSRAPKLMDSLYRGYPVSMFLYWSSDEAPRERRKSPRPVRGAPVSWLVDGQQRVITLSKVWYGDDGIEVVFNAETQEFRLANAATRKDRHWVRVADLLEDASYYDLRRALPDSPKGRTLEDRYERVRRIREYEVPVVHMADYAFDAAVDAFTRINTLGVKLKAEDIASARVAARHSGFIADEVAPFLASLRADGFTRLNVMHLFRACAFVAIPDGRSRTPLHELSAKEVMDAWVLTKRATKDAIDLVRNEFGIVNMDLLWSGALLVPVIALCATQVPRERDQRGIAGWLAMAALLHRYSGAAETALDQDLRACRSGDPIGALLSNIRRDANAMGAYAEDFDGTLMDRGALFAAYVACRHVGLKDLFSGATLLLQRSVERHHILPRAQFPERKRAMADAVANIAFIAGATNRSIGSAAPDVYLATIEEAVLTTQCIPAERNLWRIDAAAEFWAERKQLLASAFNAYLRSALPNRRIDAATT